MQSTRDAMRCRRDARPRPALRGVQRSLCVAQRKRRECNTCVDPAIDDDIGPLIRPPRPRQGSTPRRSVLCVRCVSCTLNTHCVQQQSRWSGHRCVAVYPKGLRPCGVGFGCKPVRETRTFFRSSPRYGSSPGEGEWVRCRGSNLRIRRCSVGGTLAVDVCCCAPSTLVCTEFSLERIEVPRSGRALWTRWRGQ